MRYFVLLMLLTLAPPLAYSQQMEVRLSSLTSPVHTGKDVRILVKTAANANCQITVTNQSGPIKAPGLFPKSADRKGQVRWTWRVPSNSTPGVWPITVTCAAGKQQGTLKSLLVVQ
jgi:hypothetical protein